MTRFESETAFRQRCFSHLPRQALETSFAWETEALLARCLMYCASAVPAVVMEIMAVSRVMIRSLVFMFARFVRWFLLFYPKTGAFVKLRCFGL